MKLFLSLILSTFFLHSVDADAAASKWQQNQSKGAKTQLIASFYQDDNGEKKLIAGVHFKIADGWKIYGNDSGGIGLPPSFDFDGSVNLQNHKIIWPKSHIEKEQIGDESIEYSTYKKEVILPVEIELKDLAGKTQLELKLNYGLCNEICIPANESFTLNIIDEVDLEILQKIQKFTSINIIDSANISDPDQGEKTPNSIKIIISAVLLAILGGAILNIMPCVLPVLSIKLISVISHSNASISRIRLSFIATILGILSCFVVFALLAVLIKISGNSFGWGLQFQNPYFLVFLLLVLTLFAGNLLGMFEVNFDQILANFLNKKISIEEEKKNIFIPNFLSGVLAVLLATPCSAPFLGTAISFALVQKYSVIFLIFFAIGLGFALPYLILLIKPSWVYLLPKPGAWMEKIKKSLAILLMITALWITYVLAGSLGVIPAIIVAILSVALLKSLKIKSYLLKCLSIVAIFSFIFAATSSPAKQVNNKDINPLWRQFNEIEIHQNVMKGRVVVVDVTADWCLTCKFNKIRVLDDEEIVAKLKTGGIIAMRGDITQPNEEIMTYLRKNNRFAIPFNAVYGPNAKNGLLASEFLTKKDLLELIKQAE